MSIKPIPYPQDIPPGSQAFARAVIASIEELNTLRISSASEQLATDKGLSASLQALSVQVNELSNQQAQLTTQQATLADQQDQLTLQQQQIPITTSQVSTASNVSNNYATYQTRATLSFTIPANKNVANVFVVGNAQFLDTITGGLAVSYMRLRINGVNSPQFSAAKDAGASVVNNVLFGSFAAEVTTTNFSVQLQTYATNATAYPTSSSNFYNLSVVVTYNA